MIKLPPKSKDGELLARPHFEAVIGEIASLYGLERDELRRKIKAELKKRKAIKKSTTELSENRLKQIANTLSSFYMENDAIPQELDINFLLTLIK